MRNLAMLIALGSLCYVLSQSGEPTKPVVPGTIPIVEIPQPPIGSDEPVEPIEDEPQAAPEPEVELDEPVVTPTYRAKTKVWVRTGWRRGHWEWR